MVMEKLEKTCKFHGVLSHDDIQVEPTKRASLGYVLRCRHCRNEANKRKYEKQRVVDDRKRNSSWSGGKKFCQIHGDLQEDEIIYRKTSKNKCGFQIRCKKCVAEHNFRSRAKAGISEELSEHYKKRYQEKVERFGREHLNTKEIIRMHGLTYDQYQKMFEKQKNVCKICKQPETRRSRKEGDICRLVVDHCHSTLKVRGLLCHSCNLMLGASKDSPEILQAAIRYLKAN